jgi:hypothetical protein
VKLERSTYKSTDEIRQEINLDSCVILGNGSSINDLDFSKISDHLTIGVNRIGKIFTPDIHICVDAPVCESDSPAKVSWDRYPEEDYLPFIGRTKVPSVTLACYFAVYLNIKFIYLCGADYKGNYFWGADPRKERGNHLYYRSIIKAQLTHIHSISESLIHKGGQMFNCSKDTEIEFLEYSSLFNA